MNQSKGPIRILIYVFPFLMDMIAAVILFINAVRLAKLGASALVVGGITAVWSLAYTVTCPIVGRYVTPRNAATIMLGSCLLTLLSCILFMVVTGIPGMYALCACAGVASALFFPTFQVFMKAVDTAGEKPVTYSTGVYTFAWSMGVAVGPFVAGYLMETGTAAVPGGETSGWMRGYAFAGGTAVITAIAIWLLKHLAQPGSPAAQPGPPDVARPVRPLFDYSRMPDLAWLGWVGAGVGVIVLFGLRAVFPSHAVSHLHLSESTQGTVFFLLSLSQALTGLALCRSRLWMYRPSAVSAFGMAGIIGALGFGFGVTRPVLYVSALLFGVYSGAFFFYLVFHALTHPVKSARYVAINESVVGAGGTLGPALGGILTDRFGFGMICVTGASLLFAVTLFQVAVHRRRPPPKDSRG